MAYGREEELFDPSIEFEVSWYLRRIGAAGYQWQAYAEDDQGRPITYILDRDCPVQPHADGQRATVHTVSVVKKPFYHEGQRQELGGSFALSIIELNFDDVVGRRFNAEWVWNPKDRRYQARLPTGGILVLSTELYGKIPKEVFDVYFERASWRTCTATVFWEEHNVAEVRFDKDPYKLYQFLQQAHHPQQSGATREDDQAHNMRQDQQG